MLWVKERPHYCKLNKEYRVKEPQNQLTRKFSCKTEDVMGTSRA